MEATTPRQWRGAEPAAARLSSRVQRLVFAFSFSNLNNTSHLFQKSWSTCSPLDITTSQPTPKWVFGDGDIKSLLIFNSFSVHQTAAAILHNDARRGTSIRLGAMTSMMKINSTLLLKCLVIPPPIVHDYVFFPHIHNLYCCNFPHSILYFPHIHILYYHW